MFSNDFDISHHFHDSFKGFLGSLIEQGLSLDPNLQQLEGGFNRGQRQNGYVAAWVDKAPGLDRSPISFFRDFGPLRNKTPWPFSMRYMRVMLDSIELIVPI